MRPVYAGGEPRLEVREAPAGPTRGVGLTFGGGDSSPRLSRDDVEQLRAELDDWLKR